LIEGNYFSDGKFGATDGAFKGDDRFKCSNKTPGNVEIKKLFLLYLVQTGVKSSYSRIATCFPLSGNNEET
jgi:hypothetical protein